MSPLATTLPSRLVHSVTAGIGAGHAGSDGAQSLDRRLHEAGVERPGDLQRDHPCALRRVRLERVEGGELTGHHDLAAAVEVRRLEPELVESSEQFGFVGADDGAHTGLHLGRGIRHREPALPHEAESVGLAEHSRAGRRGDLADGVPGDARDAIAAPLGEQHAQSEQSGGDDERLGDRGVADGVGVGDGAVSDEVHADASDMPSSWSR